MAPRPRVSLKRLAKPPPNKRKHIENVVADDTKTETKPDPTHSDSSGDDTNENEDLNDSNSDNGFDVSDSDEDWLPLKTSSSVLPSATASATARSSPDRPESSAASSTISSNQSGNKDTSDSTSCSHVGTEACNRESQSDVAEFSKDSVDKWHDLTDKDDTVPQIPPFQPKRPPGLQVLTTVVYSPLQLFQLFFSKTTVSTIVQNTNTYAEKRKKGGMKRKWTTFTRQEFWGLLSIVIYMGLVKAPTIRDYWSRRKAFNFPFPVSLMSLRRFLSIFAFLHFSDPEEEEENNKKSGTPEFDKLFKVKPLYTEILNACHTHFHPRRELSIDERMVANKGRYNSLGLGRKRNRVMWRFKLFVLTDASSGYTWDFLIHEGKNTMSSGKGLSYDVVTTMLASSLLGSGYKVFMGHFYTSPTLFSELLLQNTLACGTIRNNVVGYPKTKVNDMSEDARRGTIKWHREGPLLFVKWMDTQEVNILTTMHQAYSGETVPRYKKNASGERIGYYVPIPSAIKDYNEHMSSIELSEALIHQFQVVHKSRNWCKNLFYHFVDIAVVNSFVLHQELAKSHSAIPLSEDKFREALLLEMAALSHGQPDPDGEPIEELEPEPESQLCLPAYYSTDATAGRRRCVVCSVKSPIYCVKCKVTLCLVTSRNCFCEWHEKGMMNK